MTVSCHSNSGVDLLQIRGTKNSSSRPICDMTSNKELKVTKIKYARGPTNVLLAIKFTAEAHG